MIFVFRMNLSFRLNLYIFQLMHDAKISIKKFIIDEMITILIAKKKSDYEKNQKNEKTQTIKNKKSEIFFNNNQSINEKKNRNHAIIAKI